MKPDGVDAATMEPMVALDAEPAVEVAPLVEGQEQAPPASQTEETGQGEPQPAGTPAAATKTGKDKPADPKAKTKGPTKTKTPTTKTSATASRPSTTQSRMTNGVQKAQANGVAKKTPSAAPEKKTASTTAPPKKPTGVVTTKTATKPTEKKPVGTTRPATAPANGTKTTSTMQPTKKTPVTSANGDKAKPKTAGRPATGTSTSRPASAAPKPASTTTSKTSTTASKPSPSTTKMTTSTAKPSPAKTTAPPAGRTPTQSTKTPTPLKKDVSKPTTPAAKKPAASPLTRPATTKTTKPDTPKAGTVAKPDSAKKPSSPTKAAADAKTSKPKESKLAPSKEVTASPKTPSTKNSTAKMTSPKKAVGSSTPMPVKRGPKAAPAAEPAPKESEKEDVETTHPIVAAMATAVAAAAVAAAAVPAATVTTDADNFSTEVASEPEVHSEPVTELASEPKPEHLLETKSELVPETKSEFVPEPCSEPMLETESGLAPEAIPELLPEPKSELAPEQNFEFQLETMTELAVEPKSEIPLETAMDFELKPELTTALLLEAESELPTEPEPTVETIPAATEDMIQDTEDGQDILGTEKETAEDMVPQLAAELDLVSLKEPTGATSPLGTTVMSPPSSPARASPVPVEAHISAPLQDMQVPVNPWAESQSLFSEDQTSEHLQQEGKPLGDFLTATESAEEEVEDAEKHASLAVEPNLLSTSPVEHFTGASPTSPSLEKEEAVEKAEEEINEDDHDDYEEEEEEEQEDGEVGKPETYPQRPQVDDFNVGLPEFGGSSWGMMHSENCHHADVNFDDFSLKKVEMEQPYMGPPGDDHHMDVHHHLKSQEEEEQEDEDVEMVSESLMETGIKSAGNVDEDNYEEGYMDNLNRTAPAPSLPMTAAWGPSNPFAETWAQPASIHMTSEPLDIGAADPEMPAKSPAEAWLEQPLGQFTEPHLEVHEEMESSVPADGSTLGAPAIGMSQSSTLSGAALAAHSSSETSTPEELRDYDSSSGVESRSDKQQTPVPAAQPDLEQDLGIHLERGDGEEEEAETLPADEVLGDAPTAPASAPSSPSTSGDEASDTEGEMQINDPDVPVDDSAAFDSPSATRNLPALEEDEEAADMQAGEEDGGGTPQSANSVASYGFDCSASNSNAHSTAESCGKSPGIFSLENEDQLPEEAKDPSLIKELTLPAAAAHPEELLGCPVDLLPLGQQGESHIGLDDDYLMCGKTGASALEEADPESPMHLSPQHGGNTDSQPPYFSAICDKTDSFLAGNIQSGSLPSLTQEVNDNHYFPPVQNSHRQLKPPLPQQQQPPTSQGMELVKVPTDLPNGQLRRLEQHQLQLHQIQERQEQERQKRLWLEEEERQRLERQKQLERQRRELLQLQLHQQQQEHRQRRQLLQWQLELEQQFRLKMQQQLKTPSPSSGLCTIYEAMETSEDEDEDRIPRQDFPGELPLWAANGNLRRPPPRELDWNTKVDMVQQLINQALLLEGEDGCPPLLYLPGQGGGILSPLESSLWPHILPQLSPTSATITSVSSYSPTSQGSSPQGDWTIVELETHH
uniref:BTB/POZ domain-containing protein n=1 Tax=Pygocentrus nattereri TaxID=42514 RepID=A0AAR2LMK6_PYGNA